MNFIDDQLKRWNEWRDKSVSTQNIEAIWLADGVIMQTRTIRDAIINVIKEHKCCTSYHEINGFKLTCLDKVLFDLVGENEAMSKMMEI
jgi:hypothetical protein